MRTPPPTFVLRNAVDGRVICEWQPGPALWIDLQAFVAATGQSVEDVVRQALTKFLVER